MWGLARIHSPAVASAAAFRYVRLELKWSIRDCFRGRPGYSVLLSSPSSLLRCSMGIYVLSVLTTRLFYIKALANALQVSRQHIPHSALSAVLVIQLVLG
ncbi:MAG: hypothetical protein DRO13_00165 [Thermoprotei archaeon]|nr:MAG: hypothetical protein DRO13_00100 [Thermoprotei archaeon]RLG81816.1 MAG: hypothetical protein DRO13_00165 [Thermoprotei archaeon]